MAHARQARRGGVPPVHRRSGGRGLGLRRAPRADDPLRHGQLDGRPRQRRPRRRLHRPHPHDPRPARQPGRPRRHRRSRHHPQDAGRPAEEHRPDVPHRPRRRRHDRRHGRHPRLGHHRRPLRDDARERAGADGGAGRRPGHPHRQPRAEVLLRLRPHPAVRRLRRHARRHHRGDAAPLRPARGRGRRGVPVRVDGGRRQHGDPDDSARHPRRAHGDHRRDPARHRQSLLEDELPRDADAVLRVPRHQPGRGGRAGADGGGDRRASTAPSGSSGRRRPRIAGGAVAGAARRLLRDARLTARRAGHDHRRVRADLAARAVHPRDAGGRRAPSACPRRSSATPATATST